MQLPVFNDAVIDSASEIEQFLYMDPDTGMIVCMIADEDGFRPTSAMQETANLPLHWFGELSQGIALTPTKCWVDEQSSLDAYVQNFEHAFLAPFAG